RLDERRDIVVTAVDLRPIAQDAVLDARVTAPERAVTFIDTTALPEGGTRDAAAAAGAGGDSRGPHGGAGAAGRAGSGRRANAARTGAPFSLLRRRPRAGGTDAAAPGTAATPTEPIRTMEDVEPDAFAPVVLGDENRSRQVVTNL